MTVEEWKWKNPPIRRKPQTNADRIRAMSDEELAEWFEFKDDNCPRAGCYKGSCHECWLDWLKAPVEEVEA